MTEIYVTLTSLNAAINSQRSDSQLHVYQTVSVVVQGRSSVCSESQLDVSDQTCPPRCTQARPSSSPAPDISLVFGLRAQPT